MPKSKYLLLALVLFGACSPQSEKRIVTGSWLEGRGRFVPTRVPAAGPQEASCRSELYTLEEIKREALHYESQIENGPRVTGTWKHIRLANIPIGQAKFLKAIGSKVGDLSNEAAHDFSACQDAPCVVNTVYQSTDGLEGWTTYLWFLKMGSVLSFKNKVFEQRDARPGFYNGASYVLSDYLFKRDELYAFWRMSHALPTVFKTLTGLKEIHRLPKDATFEGQSANVCGLAYSQGYISLNRGCLSFSLTKDSGFIYEGTTHEMAHQIDYHWARQERSGSFYHSHNPVWKEMGGWSETEYYDEAQGKTVRRWSSTLTDAQFVRSYARTSPVEHFADTIAYYRYDGGNTKSKVPTNIYSYLQERVYESKEYDVPGLLSQFESEALTLLTPEIFQATADCEANPQSSGANTQALPESTFPFTVSEETRRCLKEKVDSLLLGAVKETQLQHVDGCRTLRAQQNLNRFRTSVSQKITSEMVKHLQAARDAREYFQRLTEYYRVLSERAEPLKLMTACYKEPNEQECYRAGIDRLLDDIIPDGQGYTVELQSDLKEKFLKEYPFATVMLETVKAHQDFINSQSALILTAAGELWERCEGLAGDDTPAPIRGRFSLGERWMSSAQYNCLNQDIDRIVRETVGSMSFEQKGVTDGKESLLLFDLAVPIFVQELGVLFEGEQSQEAQRVSEIQQNAGELLTTALGPQYSWVQSAQDDRLGQDCRSAGVAALPQDFRYHRPRQAYEIVVQNFCRTLIASPEFRTWLGSQERLLAQHLTDRFASELLTLSDRRAAECLEKHPVRNIFQSVLNKRKCRRCYLDNWTELEQTAWENVVSAFGSPVSINLSVISSRARVRTELMQEDVLENKCESSSLGIRIENPF